MSYTFLIIAIALLVLIFLDIIISPKVIVYKYAQLAGGIAATVYFLVSFIISVMNKAPHIPDGVMFIIGAVGCFRFFHKLKIES
jgi:hypothetical protein